MGAEIQPTRRLGRALFLGSVLAALLLAASCGGAPASPSGLAGVTPGPPTTPPTSNAPNAPTATAAPTASPTVLAKPVSSRPSPTATGTRPTTATASPGRTPAASQDSACADEPSKCADDSGLLGLTEQANPASVCDTISHDGWKQICLAMVNRDLARCARFTDPDTEHGVPQTYRAWCRNWVIGVMGKPELCDEEAQASPGVDKQAAVQRCYEQAAIIMRDKSLCAKTSNPQFCQYEVGTGTGVSALSLCQKGDDPCIIDYAFLHDDKAACDLTKGGVWKVSCLAALSGDHQSCRQFSDVDEWYFCDLRASYRQIMPKPNVFDFRRCGKIHQCYRTFVLPFGAWLAVR